MFLPLRGCQPIEFSVLTVAPLLRADRALIVMKVISIFPVSVVVLRPQTIRIDGGVDCPGMDIFQRIIFINKRDSVAVFLEKTREERRVQARAERAFEVVKIYNFN